MQTPTLAAPSTAAPSAAPSTAIPATATPSTATLPVHPRRGGWRAGAAASLVAFAVSELRVGRSPHRDVAALAQLGGGDLPPGLAAAEELDRRLASAVAGLVDDLRLLRARSAAFDGASGPAPLLDDRLAEVVVGTFVEGLDDAALVGCPHPGEWVASSVDVVPCAVHGYEDGPVDCLRRSVVAHLTAVVDHVDGGQPATAGAASLGEQVRAAGLAPSAPADGGPAGDTVLRSLWTGVATLAAWQAHAATL